VGPGRSYAAEQAAKATLLAAGNLGEVSKNRRDDFFQST